MIVDINFTKIIKIHKTFKILYLDKPWFKIQGDKE